MAYTANRMQAMEICPDKALIKRVSVCMCV